MFKHMTLELERAANLPLDIDEWFVLRDEINTMMANMPPEIREKSLPERLRWVSSHIDWEDPVERVRRRSP